MAIFRRLGFATDYLQCALKGAPTMAPGDIDSRMVQLENGNIRIHVSGTGRQTVLICPDGPCGLEHYREIIEMLGRRYRVVAFEPPGFGYSQLSFGYDHSLRAGAEMIENIMDATQTKSAILSLPCVAGFMALDFAFRRPERVDGLVSVQTPSWDDFQNWVDVIDSKGLGRTPVLGQLLFWATSQKVQSKWYAAAEPHRKRRQEIVDVHSGRNQKECVFCFSSTIQALSGPDPFEGRVLQKPSAILWGDKDRTHKLTSQFSMRQYLSDPHCVTVPGAGHFPEMTAPQALVGAIDSVAGCATG
jgi:pimeloyl-ACP methyl ester carboxylesterase